MRCGGRIVIIIEDLVEWASSLRASLPVTAAAKRAEALPSWLRALGRDSFIQVPSWGSTFVWRLETNFTRSARDMGSKYSK